MLIWIAHFHWREAFFYLELLQRRRNVCRCNVTAEKNTVNPEGKSNTNVGAESQGAMHEHGRLGVPRQSTEGARRK
jgi:hypothetical protein